MATKLANKSTFIGTVADISDVITKNNKEFRLVTFSVEDNKTKVFAVNEKFYMRNATRFALDTTLVVEYETTIKDKTHWVDTAGVEHVHTYDGENISNITRATGIQAKMMVLPIIEAKMNDVSDAKAMAFATLYGNLLR